MIKICGITNQTDALVAAEAGADLLGFVFYAKSPRRVLPERAREIIAEVRQAYPHISAVGVFVNETVKNVRALIEQCGLDHVQLHGDESPEMVQALHPFAYKALRPHDMDQACVQLEQYCKVAADRAPALLVDAFNPKLFGGTGERADWQIARMMAGELPILLAGGLTAENIAEAIAAVQPYGVDVSSGVEQAPGVKDHNKVRHFIANARQAFSTAGSRQPAAGQL
ncbi:MAG: phosphoribosylanthranilate isomerase [Anaerolineae bacterium]